MVRNILHKIFRYSVIIVLGTLVAPISLLAVNPPTSTYLSTISDGLSSPTRIAVGPDGNIYVTDPLKDRVLVYSPAGRWKYSAENFQGKPLSIALDAAGNIYIGDNRTKSVMVFDSSWAYLRKLGSGNGEFSLPGDIAISSSTGRIYVTDSKNNAVKIYNADGSLYISFGSLGAGSGQFEFPTGITIDDVNGEVWVSDQYNNRVQVFDLDGNYRSAIGSSQRIQGITVDSLGRVSARDQIALPKIDPSYVIVGNIPVVVRESFLPRLIEMGESVVEQSKKLAPPGLFGPFCLETILTPEEEIYVFEISARIVAGTNPFIEGSPYTALKYKVPMSTGRRIALEIKNAIKTKQMKKVLC